MPCRRASQDLISSSGAPGGATYDQPVDRRSSPGYRRNLGGSVAALRQREPFLRWQLVVVASAIYEFSVTLLGLQPSPKHSPSKPIAPTDGAPDLEHFRYRSSR
jgi:hypothetical protein